ncbi:ER membrane protein complex subunit 1 [Pleurotus pulmonarius]
MCTCCSWRTGSRSQVDEKTKSLKLSAFSDNFVNNGRKDLIDARIERSRQKNRRNNRSIMSPSSPATQANIFLQLRSRERSADRLDLFFTRAAPSNTFAVLNEHFNRGQLLVTVTGLAVAIMVTRLMVKCKSLRER